MIRPLCIYHCSWVPSDNGVVSAEGVRGAVGSTVTRGPLDVKLDFIMIIVHLSSMCNGSFPIYKVDIVTYEDTGSKEELKEDQSYFVIWNLDLL